LYTNYKEEFQEAFSKANKTATEISDILDKTKNKFMEDNTIFNIKNDFKEYLASLSIMEICLIINITALLGLVGPCVFILTCIISILFAFSGNYLIDKFLLKQKLSKLSKIIQWRSRRVKFQRYYVLINSVFIILAILSLIFVNTITLING
jgi:hypothetical protein